MGWLIAAGILAVLAVLPLGVGGTYDHTGYLLYLRIGPFKLRLLPRKRKDKKEKKNKKTVSKPKKKAASAQKQNTPKQGSLQDFFPLLRLVLDFLGNTRKKLRVDRLDAKLTLAGDDPADLAITYGNAWAAAGNIVALLEQAFVIKKRNVEVQCDFTAEKTLLFLHMDATITLGRLVCLQVQYGIPVIREYLKIMNQRKGGVKHEPKSS